MTVLQSLRTFGRRFRREQSGQTIVLMAVMMTALLCMAGFAVDSARCIYTYHQLQASADAAALAGADMLPATTATSTATLYSAVTGNKNANTNLSGVTMATGYPQVVCLAALTAQGMACGSPANGNAVVVKEQVTLPLYFLKLLGKNSLNISAGSTAAMRGSKPAPLNIAIVVDTTLSMNMWDTDCGNTQETCALNAVQTLLQALAPCSASLTTCTVTNGVAANAVDSVALFTFPMRTASTVSIDSNCTTPIPAPTSSNGYGNDPNFGNYVMPPATPWGGVSTSDTTYAFPTPGATSYSPTGPTYQVTNFVSDYRTSDTAASLNPSSALVKAVGGTPGCGSILPPNYAGVVGTWYAGALYGAQSALLAAQAANPGSKNVIIVLGDGNINSPQWNGPYNVLGGSATSSGYYPSWVGGCAQAVTAANAAAAAGTVVYAVAYGSPSTGCPTDTNAGPMPNITPCQTLQSIASSPAYFFSDYNQSGSGSTCVSSSQSITNLTQIFQQIATQLTFGRLVPDNLH